MARIIVNVTRDRFSVITTFGFEGDMTIESRNPLARTLASDSISCSDLESDLILNGEHRKLQRVAKKRLVSLIDECNDCDILD